MSHSLGKEAGRGRKTVFPPSISVDDDDILEDHNLDGDSGDENALDTPHDLVDHGSIARNRMGMSSYEMTALDRRDSRIMEGRGGYDGSEEPLDLPKGIASQLPHPARDSAGDVPFKKKLGGRIIENIDEDDENILGLPVDHERVGKEVHYGDSMDDGIVDEVALTKMGNVFEFQGESDVEDGMQVSGAAADFDEKMSAERASFQRAQRRIEIIGTSDEPISAKLARYMKSKKIVVPFLIFIFLILFILNAKHDVTYEERCPAIGVSKDFPLVRHLRGESYPVIAIEMFMEEWEGERGDKMDVCMYLEGLKDGAWEILSGPSCIEEEEDERAEKKKRFDLDDHDIDEYHELRVVWRTAASWPLSFDLCFEELPSIARHEVLIAALVLIGVYVLIVFEMVHRTLAAMMGALICLGIYSYIHERPALETTLTWVEISTVTLLFGMMIIVGIFGKTGFFEWIAMKTFLRSKGSLWKMVMMLSILTAALSSVLDNVTTVLLMIPVVHQLCEVMDIDPVPVLLSICLLSNVGGTATMIGDPPNVIVGQKLKDDVTFLDFVIYMAPGAIICAVVAILFLKYFFKKEFSRVFGPHEVDTTKLAEECRIRNPVLLLKCLIVIGITVCFFFLEPWLHYEPAWVAVIAAVILMLLADPDEVDDALEHVEWGTLLFFGALFVFMEVVAAMGLIEYIGHAASSFISQVDKENQLTVAILVITWISAFASGFIDNIPYTTMMVPVIVHLAEPEGLGLPLLPLVWSLCFGACLGGNATLIGASANVVTAGLSEQAGHPISFNRFFKVGFPTMILTVLVATLYLLTLFVWIGV